MFYIANGIMKEYLKTHASEVRNMLFTEFSMDDALRIRFEEGMETGIEKGIEKGVEIGTERTAVNLLKSGADPDIVSKGAGLSIDKVLSLSKGIRQN
jgi:predicted transposase/invertase (TIGR01784 family)